jgi:bacteriophage exclusion system BrxC/D-like protein
MTEPNTIRPRERDAIIQSLGAGVVPRIGQQHIQVGRIDEVKALLKDIDRVADGGAGIRFVIGEYGSGKTFFLNLIRSIALERKLVTVHADLTPDRRLQATGGQARALYAELMRNLATRAKPDGGALASAVERFVTTALDLAKQRGVPPESAIHEQLGQLSEMVGGYDFANVIAAYWRGHDTGNEQLKLDAVRWLRGEFTTKTEARGALGVRTIIDDDSFYDHLKLMARFVRLAGYGGLLVCLDEMVNLYKLSNTRARNANYERILGVLNDSLQGAAVGVAFLLGATPESLLDTRRGMYSYEALQSRLAENTFAMNGLIDLNGPVLRLATLSAEDLFVLLRNIRHVFAAGDPAKYLLPDDGLQAFMAHCSKRIGDAYFRTPRTTIKQFVHLLSVLEQNPQASWQELIGTVPLEAERNPEAVSPTDVDDERETPEPPSHPADPQDELASFTLK